MAGQALHGVLVAPAFACYGFRSDRGMKKARHTNQYSYRDGYGGYKKVKTRERVGWKTRG